MKISFKTFACISVAIILIVFSGCSNNENASSTEDNDKESELKIALSAEPNTLDPLISTSHLTNYANENIYESVITRDSNAEPTPELAESFDVSDDQTEYTFNLREGIKFHNGEEMTSEDVVASMIRWADMSKKTKTLFPDISFEAKDEYTVVMEISDYKNDIWDVLLDSSQYPAVMPKEVVEEADEKGVQDYIGTGPYEFVDHKRSQHIHLKKNDDFESLDTEPDGHGGAKNATIDNLYYYFVTDDSNRAAGVQTGEYDIDIQIPLDKFNELENDPDVNTHTMLSGDLMFFYNKQEGALTNKKLRQAINASIDNEQVLQAAYTDKELYKLYPGFMPDHVEKWATEAGSEAYDQSDKDKAKELLDEAEYDGEEIRIIAAKDHPEYYNVAVVLQQELQEIGVNAELVNYDLATYLEKIDQPEEFEIAVSGASYLTTPSQLLIMNSDFAGGNTDDKIDDLLLKMRTAEEDDDALNYWEELQEYLWTDY